MNKLILLFSLVISTSLLQAQAKKDIKDSQTKFDELSAKTGTIIRLVDSKLNNLRTTSGALSTRIRKFTSAGQTLYFYQIVKPGQYDNTTASIEYSDLTEILKALKSLETQAVSDQSLKPDYLENKFVTEDGFQVGYYINDGNLNWYLKLDRFGSENTVLIKDSTYLDENFANAKDKIEQLKSSTTLLK